MVDTDAAAAGGWGYRCVRVCACVLACCECVLSVCWHAVSVPSWELSGRRAGKLCACARPGPHMPAQAAALKVGVLASQAMREFALICLCERRTARAAPSPSSRWWA